MQINNIDHLNIVVSDMQTSIRFYTSIFGLNKTRDIILEGDWFEQVSGFKDAKAHCVFLESDQGSPRIELLQYISPRTDIPKTPNLNTQGLRHFAFQVDDIEAFVETLHKNSIATYSDIVEVPRTIHPLRKRLIYIHAPDGVVLELAQYGD